LTAHRILIVDDEPDVRRAFARTLKLAHFLPTEAGTADEALERCDEHTYDVVILDFMMPDMNGIELLARIRRLQPFIRSVVISGKLDRRRDERDIARELRDAVEADSYLHKPVSNETLVGTVKGLLPSNDAQDWKALAARVETTRAGTIKAANEAAKALKKHRGDRKKA
jgi:CheY-like chemotaxis protein